MLRLLLTLILIWITIAEYRSGSLPAAWAELRGAEAAAVPDPGQTTPAPETSAPDAELLLRLGRTFLGPDDSVAR